MTQMLSSLGHIATQCERPVPTVKRELDDIGAEPVFYLNAVAYYDSLAYGRVLARALGIPHPADEGAADE